jgi:DNA (cytosine-5)-methyltransferase 1
MTAGFPCQNLSMAGDKSGISGAKSGVVEKMFDLIQASRIPTILIENVYFMLQLDRGNGMRWLVERFETLGYNWAYRVLDTAGFGLPQRRRRVYLIASRTIDPRSVLFADEFGSITQEKPTLDKPLGFYWTEGRTGIGLTVDGIPPLKVGSALGIPSAPAVFFPDGEVLMPSLSACEELQGFPKGWTDAEEIRARRPEWRMVGNAVSVPVAQWVAGRIKKPGAVLEFEQHEIVYGKKWPDAAWNVAGQRVGIRASDRPVAMATPSISVFRDKSWTRLSDRALNGFIERVIAGGLRVPLGFVDALRNAGRKVGKAA